MKYLGVKAWSSGNIIPELKRAALLFDSIALKRLDPPSEEGIDEDVQLELDYLQDQGFVQPSPEVTYDTETFPWLSSYDRRILEPKWMIRNYMLSQVSKSGKSERAG